MKTIYDTLKPKRKYKRKPICANLCGICEYNKCRCLIEIKVPKTKAKIDEYFHHREKVIKRKREIELNKLDNDYLNIWDNENAQTCYLGESKIINTFSKEKKLKKHYKKMIWKSIVIMLLIPLIYVIIISLFSI